MTAHTPELLLDSRAAIAESPTWSAAENALYWIDIKEPALHRSAADGQRSSWRFATEIGAFALTEGAEGVVAALRTGLVHLAFATGRITELAPPPFDPRRFRFNEGICDAHGRFWIGAMLDPAFPATSAPAHAPPGAVPLHCFTLAEGLVAGPSPSDLHNGFAWTPDGAAFLWSHSNQRTVFRAAYDLVQGTMGTPHALLTAGGNDVVPDGAALDEDGCYWCALHGGGVLHRYDPAGRLLSAVPLPVSQPTACAFAGPRLDELVVTSARDGLTPRQLADQPHAGALFRLRPGVRGLPRPCTVR